MKSDILFGRKSLGAVSAIAITAALGFAATPAAAQSDTPAEAGRFMPNEIVVSARRRDETLQNVPIAVTAFTGERLEILGAADITYLNQTVPNVTLERSRSTNSTLTAFIRGVGQQDPVAGFEGGVGIYIDDVYLNRPQGSVLDIYDVERIEVLRGPQGTLYGRNTIGGAIKYVTKRLGDEPAFKLRVSGGTYQQADVVATFGLPITDTFKVGGTIARLTRNGFGDNLVQQGVENYNKDVTAGRVSFEWTPTPDLFVRLSGDWIKDSSDPRQGGRLVSSTGGSGLPPGTFPVLSNEFDTRADLNTPRDPNVVNRGATLLIEWDLNETFTLKNIVAYRDNKSKQQIDFDSLPLVDFQAPFVLNDDQFSEELQVLFESRLVDGVVGFYYLDATAFNAFDALLDTLIPNFNSFTQGKVKTETWSIFGDVTLDVAEAFGWSGPYMHGLEVSVGGRYTEDKRTGQVLRQLFFGPSPIFGGTTAPFATTSDFNGSETFTKFTPRVSIAWHPNEDHNLYFSWSQGFKGGGFDPRGATTGAPDFDLNGTVTADEIFNFMKFEPEEITTYEVGLKSTWNDGRASTNIAVFYSDFTNVQIPGSIGLDTDMDGIDDDFAGITTNAGAASMIGVEFEGNALLAEDMFDAGDSLSASVSVGWIDADFDQFIVPVDSGSGPVLTNVAKFLTVQNTPEWSLNSMVTYTHPLTIFGKSGDISLINSGSYRSATNQFEFDSPIDENGYFIFDASLVWTSENGRWQAGVHGKNLTDSRYIVAGYDFFTGPTNAPGITTPLLGLEGTLTAFYGDPRTVTGTIQVSF